MPLRLGVGTGFTIFPWVLDYEVLDVVTAMPTITTHSVRASSAPHNLCKLQKKKLFNFPQLQFFICKVHSRLAWELWKESVESLHNAVAVSAHHR